MPNALPILGDILTGAPGRLIEALLDALDVSAVYNNDLHQVTINATITEATPHTITRLLADPRTHHATPPTPAPATEDHSCHSAADTGVHAMALYGKARPAGCTDLAACAGARDVSARGYGPLLDKGHGTQDGVLGRADPAAGSNAVPR